MTDRRIEDMFKSDDLTEIREHFERVLQDFDREAIEEPEAEEFSLVEYQMGIPSGLLRMANEEGIRREILFEGFREYLNNWHLSLSDEDKRKIDNLLLRWHER